MSYLISPINSPHFHLETLAEGVYAAIANDGGAAISNSGIIDLGGRTLVYDTFMTPQAAQDLRDAAQKLTGRDPEIIINSHYHNDHIWGNQVFNPQALIFSTSRTLRLIETEGAEELNRARESSSKQLDAFRKQYAEASDDRQRKDAMMWVRYYEGLVDALPHLKVRLPDVTFENRLTISGSSRTVELIPFQNAHTGDDTILRLREDGVIFMADLLFVKSHLFLVEGDVFELLNALKEIQQVQAGVFVSGHGSVGVAQDLESNIDYISSCIEISRKLVEEGNVNMDRIAQEKIPERFAHWELSRFFHLNIKSLCEKMVDR